jgi:hypothetical protein
MGALGGLTWNHAIKEIDSLKTTKIGERWIVQMVIRTVK